MSIRTVEENGDEFWKDENGDYHREDGPAQIFHEGGVKNYWNRGKLHREDGPAVIHDTGNFVYIVNGLIHRIDGPAAHFGSKDFWYIDGKQYTEEEYNAKIA